MPDEGHEWVAASNVPLAEKDAKYAERRGVVRIPKATKVEVLEIICHLCRRPYEQVAGEPCIARTTTEHLRGGPIGERKKRGRRDPDGAEPACMAGRNPVLRPTLTA